MAFEHIYRPQHKSDTDIVKDFVVRTAVFQRLLADIRKDGPGKLSQHHIVQGMRGMGKSTLFERIRVEMNEPAFSKNWITVKTAEENWPVNSLLDFWIWIGQHIAAVDQGSFGALGDLGVLWNKDQQHEQCFSTIEAKLKGSKKKLLMLVDNVGDLFRKFSKQENQALRELLVTNKYIKLIGGTAVRLDQLETHDAPYFDLFKEHHMAGLNQLEVITLLQHYAKKNSSVQVEQVVKYTPHRIDHLRILTGGVPRTIMLLLDVFEKDGDATVFDDLRRTLDLVTPLYKHRMDELSPQKQKIVHALAMNWDGMAAGEIASATRLVSKVVSAQLGQLVRDGFVLRDETSTKNHFYQLAERFFNIWYLMNNAQRNGPQKVRWLTRFFELWCDEGGLKERALRHADDVGPSGLNPSDHVLVTNALLGSEHLDVGSKQRLYDRSVQAYPEFANHVLAKSQWQEGPRHLSPLEEAWSALERMDIAKAEEFLRTNADDTESNTWLLRGDIASLQGKSEFAREAYEQGLSISKSLAKKEPNNVRAMRDLWMSLSKIGEHLVREGALSLARKTFEDGLRISEALLEMGPEFAQAQRDLWLNFTKLGDVLFRMGELLQARQSYASSLRVGNALTQRELSFSYERLGDILVHEGKLLEARKTFENGLQIRRSLAETEPSNLEAQRNLSIYLNKLGNLLLKEGELLQARKFFEDGKKISRTLAGLDLSNAEAQRDLSISYDQMGDLLALEGNWIDALDSYQTSLLIRKDLAEKDPTNAEAQRDLSISYEIVGDMLMRKSDSFKAREMFEKSLKLRKSLVDKDPTNGESQRELAIGHWWLFQTSEQGTTFYQIHLDAYVRIINSAAQKVVKAWKTGELEDAFGHTILLTRFPLSTGLVLEAFLWGLARQQYHGFRELFEVRFPKLMNEFRPVYFALLRLMKDEDLDSHRRMGKELEEPVQALLARVEEMRKELNATEKEKHKAPKRAIQSKRIKRKK